MSTGILMICVCYGNQQAYSMKQTSCFLRVKLWCIWHECSETPGNSREQTILSLFHILPPIWVSFSPNRSLLGISHCTWSSDAIEKQLSGAYRVGESNIQLGWSGNTRGISAQIIIEMKFDNAKKASCSSQPAPKQELAPFKLCHVEFRSQCTTL